MTDTSSSSRRISSGDDILAILLVRDRRASRETGRSIRKGCLISLDSYDTAACKHSYTICTARHSLA